MAQEVTTTTEGNKVTTKWWSNVLTPQTVFFIIGGFISLVLFWKDSKENWEKTKALEKQIELLEKDKADRSEVEAKIKSTDDKTNRQYEVYNRMNDRINALEKTADYEKGYKDGVLKK